ncbi:MAG: polysaccharide biosynthesis protein [Phototrophicaceae bacterium]
MAVFDYSKDIPQADNLYWRHLVTWTLLDAFTILFGYLIAAVVRSITAEIDLSLMVRYVIFVVCVYILTYNYFGIYRRIWSQTSGYGAYRLIQSNLIATALVFVIDFWIRPRVLPLSVVLVGGGITTVLIVTSRYRSRVFKVLQRQMNNLNIPSPKTPTHTQAKQRTIIVGTDLVAQMLVMRLNMQSSSTNFNLIGYVDEAHNRVGMFVEGLPILGWIDDIPEITEYHQIGLIIIALPDATGSEYRRVIELCQQTNAKVRIISDEIDQIQTASPRILIRDLQPEDLLGRHTISTHQTLDIRPVRKKSILVTGAAGSIGSEIVRQLCKYPPRKLILIDSNESNLYDVQQWLKLKYPEIEVVLELADIRHEEVIGRIFETHTPQLVFHAAAYKHVPILEDHPREAITTNIYGLMNVAKSAIRHHAERFVLISTDKAVAPSSVMGATKLMGEYIVEKLPQLHPNSKTLMTCVRFGNVLSSRGSVIPLFTSQIALGGPVTVTDFRMARYFMSIPEAASLVIQAACLTSGKDIFLLRMGEQISILDLAIRMIRLHGLRPYQDIEIIETGIRAGEKIEEVLHDEKDTLSDTVHPSIFKLNAYRADISAETFFARIDDLLQENIRSADNPLDRILAVVGEKVKEGLLL